MIKVLIVDDEPLARENLRVFLQEQSDIEIVGECSNAVEGIGAVHKLRPDVLFLDIQMPRISGLEMVGMLDPEHRPYIVFSPRLMNTPLKPLKNMLLIIC